MKKRTQTPIRGQGAIEYLLIIGAAILVVAIVTIAISSIILQGQTQETSGQTSESNALTGLKNLSYVSLAGYSFQKTDPIIKSLNVYWLLDSATTFTNSLNANNGSCGPICPTPITGISGTGLNFSSGNGTSTTEQYVQINNLPNPKEVTYGIWFKTNQPGYVASFLYATDGTGANPDLFNHWRGNLKVDSSNYAIWNIGSWSCDNTSTIIQFMNNTSTQPISLNKWHFAAITISHEPYSESFYLDGQPQITQNAGTTKCGNDVHLIWLGRRKDTGGPTVKNFVGDIDEFYIWDRQLTASEIKQIYDNAPNKNN